MALVRYAQFTHPVLDGGNLDGSEVSLEFHGDQVTARLNGRTLGTITISPSDMSALSGQTQVSLYLGDAATRVDRFCAQTLDPVIPPVPEYSPTIAAFLAAANQAAARAEIGATGNKLELGLDQVDNTADSDKPISTLQATAIDNKLDLCKSLVSLGTNITPALIASGTFYSLTASATIDFTTAATANGWRCWVLCTSTFIATFTNLFDKHGLAVTQATVRNGLVEIEVINGVPTVTNVPAGINMLAAPLMAPREIALGTVANRAYTESASSLFACSGSIDLWFNKYSGSAWAANEWAQVILAGSPEGMDIETAYNAELYLSIRLTTMAQPNVRFNFGFWSTTGNGGPGTTTEHVNSEGGGAQLYIDAGTLKIRAWRKKYGLATEYGTGVAILAAGERHSLWITRKTNGNVEVRALRHVTPLYALGAIRPAATTSAITSAFTWSGGYSSVFAVASASSEAGGDTGVIDYTISRALVHHF